MTVLSATAQVSSARVFARTCRAETTRLSTVRGTWWFLLAAAVLLVGLGAIAGNDAAGDVVPPVGEPAWQVAAVAAMPAQFVLLALATLSVTADYATAGIVPTLQWTPRRTVLFVARTLVTAVTVTIAGLLLGVASGLTAYLTSGRILGLPEDVGLDVLGALALVFGTGTLLAIGFGFLLRSTAGAVVVVFLVMLVLPLLLPNLGYTWTSTVAEHLPGSGAVHLLLGEIRTMTDTSARLTMAAWSCGALLLGWLRLVRTDADR
jgi:ABC-2 type transport system permease protein